LTDAEIETLLRAGMAAPTARNLQPWQFVVVTDSTVAAQMTTGRVNRMYAEAPCLIVVCGEVTTMARPHGAPEDAEPVERENLNWPIDCSAACENILLAAHAMGLGGVWTACYPYPERYEVVKSVLGIPEKVMPLAVLPIGHPAENPAPKDKWKPEKIHYGRW
jgi:nitroreductase